MFGIFLAIVRFPVAVIASIFVIVFWIAIFPLESIVEVICFPFAAIFMRSKDIKKSWVGKFPNSLTKMWKNLQSIWEWVCDGFE